MNNNENDDSFSKLMKMRIPKLKRDTLPSIGCESGERRAANCWIDLKQTP